MAEKKTKKNKNLKLPQKRSINLAANDKNKKNILIAIPSVILIIGAAALFSKFAVVDRLNQLQIALNKEAEAKQRVETLYEKLKTFDTVSDEYDHYTYSGMTDMERTRADRKDILDLLNEKVFPYITVMSWSVSENVLTIPMKGESLEQINAIVQALEKDERVNFCTVTTAVTEEKKSVVYKETEAMPQTEEETEALDETQIGDEIESETEETESETEAVETEPETMLITEVWVKGDITCYLNPQQFEDEKETEGETANENIQP